MSRPYYMLFVRDGERTSTWRLQFGDYRRKVVEQEERDTYGSYRKADRKIVMLSSGSQKLIDDCAKSLNGELAATLDKNAARDAIKNKVVGKLRRLIEARDRHLYRHMIAQHYGSNGLEMIGCADDLRAADEDLSKFVVGLAMKGRK